MSMSRAECCQGAGQATDLRCEYLRDPLGMPQTELDGL